MDTTNNAEIEIYRKLLIKSSPYVRMVKCNFNSSSVHYVPERELYDNAILYVIKGELCLYYNGKEVVLHDGEGHLMPPLIRYKEVIKKGKECYYYVVHFDMFYDEKDSHWDAETHYLNYCRMSINTVPRDEEMVKKAKKCSDCTMQPIKIHPRDSSKLIETLQKMSMMNFQNEHKTLSVNDSFQLKIYCMQILNNFFGSKEKNESDYHKIVINKFIMYVNENYAKEIDYNKVVKKFGFTPNYFRKILKDIVKVPTRKYITIYRINKAKELLNQTDFTIMKICEVVGYKDPFYFSKAFKREVGVSPNQFREKK